MKHLLKKVLTKLTQIYCLVVGHNWTIEIVDSNDKEVFYDHIYCKRCGVNFNSYKKLKYHEKDNESKN